MTPPRTIPAAQPPQRASLSRRRRPGGKRTEKRRPRASRRPERHGFPRLGRREMIAAAHGGLGRDERDSSLGHLRHVLEACNCEAICPCLEIGGRAGGRSTYDECISRLWAVLDGGVGDVDLAGLGAVMATRYSDDEPGSPWTFALYVDERGDDLSGGPSPTSSRAALAARPCASSRGLQESRLWLARRPRRDRPLARRGGSVRAGGRRPRARPGGGAGAGDLRHPGHDRPGGAPPTCSGSTTARSRSS